MADIDFDALKESLVRREAAISREPPSALPPAQLEDMAAAGEEVEECVRVVEKGESNLVAEVLRGEGKFYEWNHYPKGDVYDTATHSQYYYHAHPSELRPGEHGHFHTFVRFKGLPKSIKPVAMPSSVNRPTGKDAIAHIVGFSMDKKGYPFRVFTVNRWVTGESWYSAEDVLKMVDLFKITHAVPTWPTNRWVSAMMRLFRPQIDWLLHERDEAVRIWQSGHPDSVVYEDHGLEVPSVVQISIEDQIRRVREALG